MHWIVPNVPEWRELPSGCIYRFTPHHVRGPADFCMHCRQDLRAPMLLVNAISDTDRLRYGVCYDAFSAEQDGDEQTIRKCNEYGLTADDRQNLALLFNQGWRVVLEGSCGPDDMTFVGVRYDGILLFAVEDQYEVGKQIRLRYE